MENELRLNVRIPADLYREFKAQTTRQGLYVSDVIRQMIEQWLIDNAAQTSK